MDCTSVLDTYSLSWLPPSKSGSWNNFSTLYADFTPDLDIPDFFTILDNSIYYNYIYSIMSANKTTVPVKSINKYFFRFNYLLLPL